LAKSETVFIIHRYHEGITTAAQQFISSFRITFARPSGMDVATILGTTDMVHYDAF